MKLNNLMDHYVPTAPRAEAPNQERILKLARERLPRQNIRPKRRLLRLGAMAAALTVALSVTVAAVVAYSKSTRLMQAQWETAELQATEAGTSMPPEQRAYLEGRTVTLAQSATDQGLTVTLESMTVSNHSVTFGLSYQTEDGDKFSYSLEDYGLQPWFWSYSWVNPSYGSVAGQRSTADDLGMLECNTWTALPDDQIICDGDTAIELELRSLYVTTGQADDNGMAEKVAAIEGSWQFTVSIPKLEPEPEYTVDMAQLEAAAGCSDISVLITSTGCSLVLPESLTLSAPEQVASAQESGENIAVAFYLKNGEKVPDFGSVGWTHDGVTEYVIPWVALDPTQLGEMRVYREGTEQSLSLIPTAQN